MSPSFTTIPKRHHYSVGVVTLSSLLIVMASVGLRAVGQVFELFARFMTIPRAMPSWSSCRLWLLRIGYYKLTRPKAISTDWVWVVDHTIQAGDTKCLSIMGVCLSKLDKPGRDKILLHEDLEPITLEPVRKSNGDIVYTQLNDAIGKTGVPRQIIADRGSDLRAGIDRFLNDHPETAYIYDIKHFTADVLEKELKNDLMWTEFCKWCSETRSSLHQTPLSYLEPPNQRSKSRFMNMEILVDWGVRILSFFDPPRVRAIDSDEMKLVEKLSWIRDFRTDIAEWKSILELVEKAETFVRTKGIFLSCDMELRSLLRIEPGSSERLVRIRWCLIEHLLDESLKVKPGECLLGSSEVLESVFGKFKYLQDEHSKRSITAFVLSIAAMVSQTTEDVVQQALELVPVKIVRAWAKQKFGQSAASKRKQVFASKPIKLVSEQNQDRISVPA